MWFPGLLNLNKAFSLRGNLSLPLCEEGDGCHCGLNLSPPGRGNALARGFCQRRNRSGLTKPLGADKRRPPDVSVFAERPPIAVGIKGPMNFWVWYETGRRKLGQLRGVEKRIRRKPTANGKSSSCTPARCPSPCSSRRPRWSNKKRRARGIRSCLHRRQCRRIKMRTATSAPPLPC